MDLNHLLDRVKKHPEYKKVGMVLCHNGVVRATSRDGKPVNGLRVAVDAKKLEQVIAQNKARDGIVEILVEINAEKDLVVGDDVMLIVVVGDIRENVIAVLSDTLNAVKSSVTHKTEFYS